LLHAHRNGLSSRGEFPHAKPSQPPWEKNDAWMKEFELD
jgi:hypothetical protein